MLRYCVDIDDRNGTRVKDKLSHSLDEDSARQCEQRSSYAEILLVAETQSSSIGDANVIISNWRGF